MDHKRRVAIEKAVARLSAPTSFTGATAEEICAKAIRHKDATDTWVPGDTVRVLKRLPPHQANHLARAIEVLDEIKDMGRHGNPDGVSELFGVDKQILESMHSHGQDEYIVSKLLERRGSDADLGIPPLTRGDHISAALDAHGFKDES
jgi:hypothetical protein